YCAASRRNLSRAATSGCGHCRRHTSNRTAAPTLPVPLQFQWAGINPSPLFRHSLKRIKRWKHENVLDAMQATLDGMRDAMGAHGQTGEPPFGTFKSWMGSTHFLTKTLKRVRTEMSLHVLAYNMKRVIAIIGVGPLLQAIRA